MLDQVATNKSAEAPIVIAASRGLISDRKASMSQPPAFDQQPQGQLVYGKATRRAAS